MAQALPGVTVTGFDQFRAKLAALPRVVARKYARQALRAGAKPMQAALIAAAPVGLDEHQGITQESIKIRAIKRTRKGIGLQVVTLPPDDWKGDAFYPSFAEFGHFAGKIATNETIGVTKGKRRTLAQQIKILNLNAARRFVLPLGWMRRAIDGTRAAVDTAVIGKLRSLLEPAFAAKTVPAAGIEEGGESE